MDVIGPYRLDAAVGRGTAGSVWRATRSGPVAQVVAVKRARVFGAGVEGAVAREATDRLRREAAILIELDHPHIVRIIDVLADGDGVAIVMSLARGGSLHDLLAERGRLTAGQTVAVLSRIADALASAHRRGVLHGDVKPANVLFTADGEPVLGDFGAAQHLVTGRGGRAGRAGRDGAPAGGSVEGTDGYVDPELVASGRPDPGNDVYGVAVVAYLCLTGRPPHAGRDARRILNPAEVGDHLPLSDEPQVPARLAELIEAALDRDPAVRPATAQDLARGLRAAVDPASITLPGIARAVVDPQSDPADCRAADDTPAGLQDAPVPARPGPSAGSSDGPVLDPGVMGVDAQPRGTRSFGPRPPRPEPASLRRRRLPTGVVVVALVAAAGGSALWARGRPDHRPARREVAVEAAGGEGRACPRLPPIEVPAGAQALTADVRGDGCPVPVVWDGQVMRYRVERSEPAPRRLLLEAARGGAGQLLLGDWDCDGADTPAYYQPGTGAVSYFADLPQRVDGHVPSTQDATGVVNGQAEVARGDEGCDTVEVSPQA